ncbi:hypothetical protein GIB67_009070 [Kingdonia uniflora]|uniref:Gnk2-homologous domain-containing protein n=1 Tax=Kingdonia uniflora TaxID=39325 RepID=A0A7J7MNR6_9MAGN|nr:hypothetical protein GIB67_009070 [Kingdonia uniflora]
MGLPKNPISPIYITLLVLLTSIGFLPISKPSSETSYTTLVYKGCANQTFSDPSGVYSQTLSSLFDSLITQSSKSNFFKTTSSGGGGGTSITGLYQCRGDLSNGDCNNCVSKIPEISSRLCGKTVAGRIQLSGCYALYEVSGFPQISGVEMLYKMCSRTQAEGSGFETRRDTAFMNMENGMGNGKGFYATSYESLYVLGQCEGSLSTGDCGECVKTAVQRAQVECGSSIAGQVYLHKCYMSYTYYPNGVPKEHSSGGGDGGGGGGGGGGSNRGKTIAIAVGGTAAVGFLVICLMFMKSLMKKHDDY